MKVRGSDVSSYLACDATYVRACIWVIRLAKGDAVLRLAVRVVVSGRRLYLLHAGWLGCRRHQLVVRKLAILKSVLVRTNNVETVLIILLNGREGGGSRSHRGNGSGGAKASTQGLEGVAARHRAREGRRTDEEGELSVRKHSSMIT